MQQDDEHEITRVLEELNRNNRPAVDELLPLVYTDLRRMARGELRKERPGHTLQATALVHEAYIRLLDQRSRFRNRGHFFGIAAQVIRYVLRDYAKRYHAAKRGGGAQQVPIDENIPGLGDPAAEIMALDEALTELARLDERQAKVVELKFYGGFGVEETAEALGISTATVKREWHMAQAWLRKRMGEGG